MSQKSIVALVFALAVVINVVVYQLDPSWFGHPGPTWTLKFAALFAFSTFTISGCIAMPTMFVMALLSDLSEDNEPERGNGTDWIKINHDDEGDIWGNGASNFVSQETTEKIEGPVEIPLEDITGLLPIKARVLPFTRGDSSPPKEAAATERDPLEMTSGTEPDGTTYRVRLEFDKWIIRIVKPDGLVTIDSVPMTHEPRFGPDALDVANVNVVLDKYLGEEKKKESDS